ncbi:MAG: hypothetical protein ACLFWD_06780 [Anaerolineales bacterium]
MSKWIKFVGVGVLAAALVVGGVSVASAQSDNPTDKPALGPWGPNQGQGPGPGMGLMAEYSDVIHEALADALGISVSEFEQAREDGLRLPDLAEEYDVELDELFEVMNAVRVEVLEQALEDGVISQEQYDWMSERPGVPGGVGPRVGRCDGEGPMRDGTGTFAPRGGRFGGRR